MYKYPFKSVGYKTTKAQFKTFAGDLTLTNYLVRFVTFDYGDYKISIIQD